MEREEKQRVAMNEATFRKVNEGMEAGQDDSGLLTFVCECGRLKCTRLIHLDLCGARGGTSWSAMTAISSSIVPTSIRASASSAGGARRQGQTRPRALDDWVGGAERR